MEEEFLDEFRELALQGPCRVAIDVGANQGDWTRWMAPRFERVIACEPDWRAEEAMRWLGLPHNATLLPVAVGRRIEQQKYFLRGDTKQSSLGASHPIGGSGQEEVETVEEADVGVVTLDLLCHLSWLLHPGGAVDLIKIDVEGGEEDVLAGVETLAEQYDTTRWIIEVHNTREAVGREIHRLGYDKIRVLPHPHKTAHPGHCWVFIPARSD